MYVSINKHQLMSANGAKDNKERFQLERCQLECDVSRGSKFQRPRSLHLLSEPMLFCSARR